MLSCMRSSPSARGAPATGATDDNAFAAARIAASFVDELAAACLARHAYRFEITLHAKRDLSALLGAEDVLKASVAAMGVTPACEQIWAGEYSDPEAGMSFTAFDAYGAALLRRTYPLDACDAAP